MQKRHQINIITAQPNEKGFRAKTTKSFILGKEDKSYFPKYWKQKIIEWDDLEELYKTLEPYLKGTHPEAYYSCLMHGQFIPGTEDIYGNRRQNINIEDTPHNYLILDIETDSPEYEELCLDLTKVRHWMEATYPWITEDTGMILYQTASAGVLRTDGTEKHKQIRVRAIMEITSEIPLNESMRKHLLRPYMKLPGKDFHRHIDNATHQKARVFYMAPPLLTNTKRLINSDDICRLRKGKPIEFESLRDFDIGLPSDEQTERGVKPSGVSSSASSSDTPNRLMKQKPPIWHWNRIQEGARYENIFNVLGSAHFRDEIWIWRNKLLKEPSKLGDRGTYEIDTMIKWIEEHIPKDLEKPTDKLHNHNILDIEEYRLDKWQEKTKNTIAWKDKGVILQKLYEGAGKTKSLKQLREQFSDKSFLYIAPNTKPVITTCKDLGLTSYEGLKEDIADVSSQGQPIHSSLGICYPSLMHMEGSTPGTMKDVKWDIVVMDEIEQLLIFGVDGGGCIVNPEFNNGILRQLVEKADLVVGMDARLSNLSLQALETWRVEDDVFDIYTQSKVKPWNNKKFTIVDSTEMTMNYIREAVSKGKKVAVVSELDRSGRGLTLQTGMKFIEEATGKKGWCVDQNNKGSDESNRYINELGKWTEEGLWEMGELEKDLKDGTISHMWASPVLQSAWSYQSEECPFDLVVGLYPNSVLTAPNIVQHISRFRTSTEFVMYVNQQKRFRLYDIYQKMYPPTGNNNDIDLGLGEFNQRHALHDYWENIQKQNRQAHLIEIIEARGGTIKYDYTKITEENKELSVWLKENHAKAWKFLRSQRAFNIAKKYRSFEN